MHIQKVMTKMVKSILILLGVWHVLHMEIIMKTLLKLLGLQKNMGTSEQNGSTDFTKTE